MTDKGSKDKKSRLEELKSCLADVDEGKKAAIMPLLGEIVFIEGRLAELRALPHIRVKRNDRTCQEITAAGKQYKEFMQAYLNAIKVVLTALYRTEGDGADELMKKLSEFDLS